MKSTMKVLSTIILPIVLLQTKSIIGGYVDLLYKSTRLVQLYKDIDNKYTKLAYE